MNAMAVPESRLRANAKYIAKTYEQISIREPKGTRDAWKAAAEKSGKSLAQFIADAVEHEIENECL